MNKNIVLIGNPNSGKTTLFNSITGTYQKVGNWAGVTTEKKEGVYKKQKQIKVVDLPGIYSFSAQSKDEKAVIDYVKSQKIDCIINVVDGTNLERNLYLTAMLSKLNIKTVLAVTFLDELDKKNQKLDCDMLSKFFGVPVVQVSAVKNVNVDKLMDEAISNTKIVKPLPTKTDKEVYSFIENVIKNVLSIPKTPIKDSKVDKLLMGRFVGPIIFVAVIFTVYLLSNGIGGFFSGVISRGINDIANSLGAFLRSSGVPEYLISFFNNGIIKGVGTVISFLPQILILFILLTLLEESGYMARVSFITDRVFRGIGLGGKSVIPLVLSCGCTVTGIMATRTIENKSERKMTTFIAPFMPCGAKCAVFSWFSIRFFNGSPLISTAMYFISVIVTIISGKILSKIESIKGKSSGFLLEIPPLRRPRIKDVLYVLKNKTKDFLIKSGTVIFLVSVCVWGLQNFGTKGYTNGVVEESFLYGIGQGLKFIFTPLGFGNWKATISALTGTFAKEGVIETAEIIGLSFLEFYSIYSVWAFMIFILLSPPCTATLSLINKELKSKKDFVFMLLFQFFVAYFVAFSVNIFGVIISDLRLLLSSLIVIISVVGILLAIATHKRTKHKCFFCKGKEKCPINTKHNTII